MKPTALDLFCGAGGVSKGLSDAGFDVWGVDIERQRRYVHPGRFVQADALAPPFRLADFDFIWASPPCQGYSRLRHLPWLRDREWPLLIPTVREMLVASGVPYCIENVMGAPLSGFVLCGTMFGLPTFRHRRFETNFLVMAPPHERHNEVIGCGRMVNDRRRGEQRGTLNAGSRKGAWGVSKFVTVAGGQFKKADGVRALGIDWMTKAEMAEAIPPAYAEFVGRAAIQAIGMRVAA